MSVRWKDKSDDSRIHEARKRELDEALFSQVGFRWIVDGLAGRSLAGFQPKLCDRSIVGDEPYSSDSSFARRIDELKHNIRSSQRALVGHNCFLDLVYFYKMFFEDLPDSVEDFATKLHAIFPIILDTKYLATSSREASRFSQTSLDQLDEGLAEELGPRVAFPDDQTQFSRTAKYHEAAYDSFATAKIFLKLANKLGLVSEIPHNPLKNQNPGLDAFTKVTTQNRMKKMEPMSSRLEVADRNPFDALQSAIVEDSSVSSSELRDTGDAAPSFWASSSTQAVSATRLHDWHEEGWQAYNGKLRVYGTLENAIDLTVKHAKTDQIGFGIGNVSEETTVTLPLWSRPITLTSVALLACFVGYSCM